ncbi:MAG: FAD-binding oxidoreductase, partial [Gammaproteobacteria bacterium]|nr:FAD-binding oxidoreductase [Gammaproteobacteria bacterium]
MSISTKQTGVESSLHRALLSLLGEDDVRTAEADLLSYSYDNSRLSVTPEAVLFPHSEEQIREIVYLCKTHNTP